MKSELEPVLEGDFSADEYFGLMVRLSEQSLICYAVGHDEKYRPGAIHKLIARVMELCEQHKLTRVIITMPPRHGKSRLVAEEFASWYLSKHPDRECIVSSYAQDRSNRISLNVRNRLETNLNMAQFPKCRVDPDNRRIDDWLTTEKGGMLSAGVGGAITGRGADLFIIDDPIKNREEAESELARDRVWDWFTSTAYTRLSPNGIMVIIMTRWHPDDLVGRLLDPKRVQEMEEAGIEAEKFVVFKFPALATREEKLLKRKVGDPLWPERWTANRLKAVKMAVGSYDWEALYQCSPRRKGGNYINRNWFQMIKADDLPRVRRTVRFWDLACSEDTRNDPTAGVKMSKDGKGNFYIENVKNFHENWPAAKRQIVSRALVERLMVGAEGQGGFKIGVSEIKMSVRGKVLVRGYSVEKDKLTRALPFIAAAEAGKIFVVIADWNYAYFEQLEQFPTATHDDMVDATSGAHYMLTHGAGVAIA